MKLRTGFVSNSSSSSFVVLTTKENHDAVMAKMDDYAKVVVASVMEEKKFAGIPCVQTVNHFGNYGVDFWNNHIIKWDRTKELPEDYIDNETDIYATRMAAVKKYHKALEENSDAVFATGMDF